MNAPTTLHQLAPANRLAGDAPVSIGSWEWLALPADIIAGYREFNRQDAAPRQGAPA